MASSISFEALIHKTKRNASQTVSLPVRGGRQTIPDVPTSLSDRLMDMSSTIPDFNLKFLDALEKLAVFHEDISYAVDNIVQLGNTEGAFPDGVYFDDAVGDRLAKEMITRLKIRAKSWYAFAGGLNSITNDLLAQAAISGAVSAECIPTDSLDGIKKVVIVAPKHIRFKYDDSKDEYIPHQVNNQIGIVSTLDSLVELNTTTYFYSAIRRIGEKPYAIPPFLSALESVVVGRSMKNNFGYIIKKLGMLGFLEVLVNGPKPVQGETDEAYYARTGAYLDRVVPEIDKGMERGFVAGFKGMQEFKMHSTANSVQGAKDLVEINDVKLMAGLKQDPLMFGRNFSTTETLGRVILAKMTTQISNYQQLVCSFYEKAFLLDLQLAGFPVKNVIVEFGTPSVGDRKRDAETRQIQIGNVALLYSQGIISQQQRANELGYEKPDQEEPRPMFMPFIPESSPAEDPAGAEADTETDPTDEKTTGGNTKISNNIERAVAANFGHLAEYPYESGGCGCGNHGVSKFARHSANDTMQRWKDDYYNDTATHYDKSVREMSGKIARKMAAMSSGVSEQAVTDMVIYTLYNEWRTVFTKKQAKIVSRFVLDIYAHFRKASSTAFGEVSEVNGKKIPKGAFNTTDIRAMEYYKKSDTMYLGKFVTDESLRTRLSKYLKDNYLGRKLPIGKGADTADAIANFRKEFGELMHLEDWKITRIIDTTVNKMRNTAAVSYMSQADVERFEIVGVNDQLQCEYCASMQGKTFSVGKAVDTLNQTFSSDPELVGVDRPFLTSVVKDPEELKNLDGDALQMMGIDTPPYHGSCRDDIVAVL